MTTVLWDVAEEHLDEAAFLFGAWRECQHAPNYSLDENYHGNELRLQRHLDALALGGTELREALLIPTVRDSASSPAHITTAAVAAMRSQETEEIRRRIIGFMLEATSNSTSLAIAEALNLVEIDGAETLIVDELARKPPTKALVGCLRVLTHHQVDPGSVLTDLTAHQDFAVKRHALQLATILQRNDQAGNCWRALISDDRHVRVAAMNALLAFNSKDVRRLCYQRAKNPTADDSHCLLLLGLIGDERSQNVLRDLLERGVEVESTLWAASFAGRPRLVERALEWLDDESARVCRLAAEVVTSTAGLNREENDLIEQEEMEEAEFFFEDEDLDTDIAPDSTDLLPKYEADSVRSYWQERKRWLNSKDRHIGGLPLGSNSLHNCLLNDTGRRRAPWCLALSLATNGAFHVPHQHFRSKQLRTLEALNEAPASNLARRLEQSFVE